MASNRYDPDTKARNSNKLYKKYLYETRGLSRGIAQYQTQTFRYPTTEEIASH